MRLHPLLSVLLAVALAACSNGVDPSESRYSRADLGSRAPVERCRVIDVRQVRIDAAVPDRGYSRYGRAPFGVNPGAPEAQAGAVIGGLLGAALGSQLGGGSGQDYAMALGAATGSFVGRKVGNGAAERRGYNQGVEYSVILNGNREEVIVQGINPGDRIVSAGSTCRIASTASGPKVLPGEYLPASVPAPRRTVIQ